VLLAAWIAGCGSGTNARSTSVSAGPKVTSVYLRCETEANVARNILANAHGSLGPPETSPP
jgi:hypothetical protein